MTIDEFHQRLLACQTLDRVAPFVRNHFDDISLLFYDVARGDVRAQRTQQKRTFDRFLSGQAIRSAAGDPVTWPPPVLGLLVLFASFFERAAMYAELNDVVQTIPPSPIRTAIQVIMLYRRVSDAKKGYREAFPEALAAISPLGHSPLVDSILAEFYATGTSVAAQTVDTSAATAFSQMFIDAATQCQHRVLCSPELARLYQLSPACLAAELPRLNIRVVEAIYDVACQYVAPPLVPDPGAGEQPVDPNVVGVTLPHYLDQLIFGRNGLGGVYAPDPEAVLDGMSADDQRQRVYIGTYLPRSFAESYRVFGPLLASTHIKASLRPRKVLNILDIGAGTGGDIVGLLHAVAECDSHPSRIDIVSVEGNPSAISYQQRIVAACQAQTGLNIRLDARLLALPTTTAGFAATLAALQNDTKGSFDIVMTWKTLNEFYHKNYASAQGIYQAYLEFAAHVVAPHGLCLVLDTSNKVKGRATYIPVILNREAKAYVLADSARLAHVLPRSCAYWDQQCQTPECYTQRIFYVSHSQRSNVECKTTYKVFAPKPFAATINADPAASKYRCNTAKPTQVCRQATIEDVSVGARTADGFVLT